MDIESFWLHRTRRANCQWEASEPFPHEPTWSAVDVLENKFMEASTIPTDSIYRCRRSCFTGTGRTVWFAATVLSCSRYWVAWYFQYWPPRSDSEYGWLLCFARNGPERHILRWRRSGSTKYVFQELLQSPELLLQRHPILSLPVPPGI